MKTVSTTKGDTTGLKNAYREIVGDMGDEVPEGWRSKNDWAKAEGIARSTAQIMIDALLKAGRVEERVFRVYRGSRFVRLSHYRLIPDP